MNIAKKTFFKGLNTDVTPRLLGQGMYLNLMNGSIGISEDGRDGRIENRKGTTQVASWSSLLPTVGTNKTIGSTTDDVNKRVIALNYNSSATHAIYCYEKLTGISRIVLKDDQVTGGLKFSDSSRVDRNIRVVDGMLYFTDGTENGQRKINIDAAIKMNDSSYSTTVAAYTAPLNFSEITLIKPPPALSPTIKKEFDSATPTNFIANESFSYAFRYIYRDNEKSVIGPYSVSSRLNKVSDNYNRIVVKMAADEFIPDTVKMVVLVVRIGTSAFEVKIWDKAISTEATEITNHNAGTTPLTFNFYNNITGAPVPQGDILKPFDSVPRSSKTLEFAKDRIFLGNNKDGYDSPTLTSITTTQTSVAIAAASIVKNLISIRWRTWIWENFAGTTSTKYVLYDGWYVYININEIPNTQAGYYLVTSTEHAPSGVSTATGFITPPYSTLASAPTSSTLSGLTFKGATQADVLQSTQLNNYRSILGSFGSGPAAYDTEILVRPANFFSITGISVSTFDIFKSRSQYQVGATFYDFAMRKCGIVRSPNLISIPARDYSFNSGIQAVQVNVSNANAVNEIPDWAYYYSFDRTLNLKTRFFVQSYDNALRYATKKPTGEYVYDQVTFVTGTVALAIDTTSLVQSGLGYTFTEGDVCYLITSSSTSFNIHHEVAVIGQDGKYILLNPINIGNLTTTEAIYEIYTPYKTSAQEPFYEMGQVHKVLNPTTPQRVYSVTSEIMLPDAYVLTRSYQTVTYFAEAMSPNDLYYKRWDNDGGKVNYVTKLGTTRKTQYFRWSDTYITGTSTNGLHTFEALNEKAVPLEIGPIQKLQLADKISDQGQGNIMLAICQNRTTSLYLGEMQLSGSGKTSDLIRFDEVVGSINVLKGSGTITPESVIEKQGIVFWINTQTGDVIQYSANGLDSISKFNVVRFFKKYCKNYTSADKAAVSTINGFSHIPTALDPFNNEFLVTTPALTASVVNLPSYTSTPTYATSIINRFDLCDNLAKTLAFDYASNLWGENYEYAAEWYEYLDETMYGFKAGKLYIHNSDAVNYNRFYGVDKPMRLCFALNDILSADKDIMNIAIEGSAAPEFTVAYSDNPNQQITDLIKTDYTKKGTSFFAKFMMDRLSPGVTGTAEQKMINGDVITGNPLLVMVEFQPYSKLMYLDVVDIGYSVSRGLSNIVLK
jgi:hypothetical protein